MKDLKYNIGYILFIIIIIILFLPNKSNNDSYIATISDKNSEIDELKEDNELLDNSYYELKNEYSILKEEYHSLEDDIEILQNQLIENNINPLIPKEETAILTDSSTNN
jgi:predicted nuclease with TOPRIM domain